jgi:nucleoside-diphosphate-sugar epimerase
MNKNTRILITGATGFIGRFLVQELCAKGYADIKATARRTSSIDSLKNKGVNIIFADITDKKSLDNIRGEYDVLFHCAGFVSDGNEKNLSNINIQGTKNVCQWSLAQDQKIYLFKFRSS